MMDRREALRVRAEYALWSGRKELHQLKVEILRGKYILEQDVVNRLERGIFSKWKRDYGEKLDKEQAEVNAAKAAWEQADSWVQAADEKLPELRRKMEECTAFWKTEDGSAYTGEEKQLLQWCKRVEKLLELSGEINDCILCLKEGRKCYKDEIEERAACAELQRKVDAVWESAGEFAKELQGKSAYDLRALEEKSFVAQVSWHYPARLVNSLAVFDVVDEMVRINSAISGMETEMEELRERLTDIFDELAEDGEGLLCKTGRGEVVSEKAAIS